MMKLNVILLVFVSGVYGYEAGTFDDQFINCKSIQNPDQPEVHEAITKLLRETEQTSVWLPVKKQELDGWRWLQGNRFYNTHLSSPGSSRPWQNCGIFRTMESFRIIDDVSCSKMTSHFLCKKPGSSCAKEPNCFVYSENRYTVHNVRSTWHQARDACQAEGAILASLPDQKKAIIAMEIERVAKQSVDIWIGLRNADYVLVTAQQMNSTHVVGWSMWDVGHPCECINDVCVILSRNDQGDYRWRTENCTANHTIICQQDVIQALSSAMTTPTNAPSSWFPVRLDSDMFLIIVGASVGGVLLIIILAMCCCSCCQQKKKNKRRVKRGQGPWDQHYKPAQAESYLLEPPKPKNGAHFADPASYESRSNLYYAQMPGKTGTLSNPNIPAGIEPTDFTLTAVLKRPKATVKQQEHMKQEYKASGEMTEACFEWIVKDLDEHLLVNNEQTSFMKFALGHTEATADVLRRRYVMDRGVAAIYLWRAGEPVKQSWNRLHQIIQEYKYFNLQPWLQQLFI